MISILAGSKSFIVFLYGLYFFRFSIAPFCYRNSAVRSIGFAKKEKKTLVFAEMLTVVMLIQKYGVVNDIPFFFQINSLTNFFLINLTSARRAFKGFNLCLQQFM